jgi:hypothetical protein
MLKFLSRARLTLSLLAVGCIAPTMQGCEEEVEPTESDDDSADDADSEDDQDDTDGTDNGSVDDGDDNDDDVAPIDAGRDAGGKPPKAEPGKDAGKDAGRTDAGGPARDSGPAEPPIKTDGGPDTGTPGGDGGGQGEPSTGCTAKLPEISEDVLDRGPWESGVRTAKIGRLTVEVFYPAKQGSTAGKDEVSYDARQFLPAAERSKVTDDHAHIVKPIGGHLFRDVPIDEEYGPYPVVVFIHGTASHRVASVTTHTHWASRGFVVLSADYPGLGLGDQMASTLECLQPTTGAQDIPGDVNLQLNALKAPSGDVEFLTGRVDMKRLAISGHSQGGCMTATLAGLPDVKLVMPISGSTAIYPSTTLESILFVSGMTDTVIGYDFPLIGNTVCPIGSTDSLGAYNGSAGPPKVKKRLMGISGGGHLAVTDLCEKNAAGKTSVDELLAAGVCGVSSAVIIGLPALFDCGTVDWKKGVEAVNYATTAALEETLHCKDRTAQFAAMKTKVPQVGDFKESVK